MPMSVNYKFQAKSRVIMITCFYNQKLFLKIHMQLFFMGTNLHIIKEIQTKVTKEVTVLQGPNRSSHL